MLLWWMNKWRKQSEWVKERNQIKVSNRSRWPHQELASTADPSILVNSLSTLVPGPGVGNSRDTLTFSYSHLPPTISMCFSYLLPSSTSSDSLPRHFYSLPEGGCLQSSPPFLSSPLYPPCSCTRGLGWTYGSPLPALTPSICASQFHYLSSHSISSQRLRDWRQQVDIRLLTSLPAAMPQLFPWEQKYTFKPMPSQPFALESFPPVKSLCWMTYGRSAMVIDYYRY